MYEIPQFEGHMHVRPFQLHQLNTHVILPYSNILIMRNQFTILT